MAEAWAEVLVGRLPPRAVRGVYFKGSALKPWDSPIDYVPGLSDVDVHVLLGDDRDEAHLNAIDIALEVNAAVLATYRRRAPAALHLPRPQLVLANRLEQDATILPSPAATVETLFGEPYVDHVLTEEEQAAQRARDREQLRRPSHIEFIDELPFRAIDRLGERLTPLHGELNWRVSPVAPRVLEVLGMAYAQAWSLNRTHLVAGLRERGLETLADAYESYYVAGWRLFIDGTESPAAFDIFRAGIEVVRLGAEVAAAAP
jgi:hypothetical protein